MEAIKKFFEQRRDTKRKRRFVNKFLKPLLINADIKVCDVRYRKNRGCETVAVTYRGGGEVVADVSRGSLIEICRDTLKIL